MTITNIQIRVIPQHQDTLVGWGMCEIDNVFRVSGIGLHTTKDGKIRVNYPSKKLKNGEEIFSFQPISQEEDEKIVNAFNNRAKEIGLFDL